MTTSNNIHTLVSTMHQDNLDILDTINLQSDSIIINQSNNNERKIIKYGSAIIKVISTRERGLSKSRNLAISNSDKDICLLSDDDQRFCINYLETIAIAFNKYPKADIIAFGVNFPDGRPLCTLKEGRVGVMGVFKISSVQIAFKRQSVLKAGIKFDERFGAGSGEFIMGEENIFLSDCYRAGLKIYYFPDLIAELLPSESSWFEGYTENYFVSRGAMFYRISPLFGVLLCLQFAIRKKNIYQSQTSIYRAFIYMLRGIHMYKSRKGQTA